MSKILAGTCVGLVVSTQLTPPELPPLPALPVPPVPPLPVPLATILGQGVGLSTGIVIFDGPNAFYIPNISGDLKATLTNLISTLTQVKTALDKVGSALTSIDTRPYLATGDGVPGSPTAAADITSIAAAATAIDVIKTTLNTLNGALK